MVLFKLMSKNKVNKDIGENFFYFFVYDVNYFFVELDNGFKY